MNSLENYDEVYRAVAYFAFRYGRIDWIESNNEYWLEQDARLRTDFNVTTGLQTDRIRSIKEKSEMKKYYAKGDIPTARQMDALLKEKNVPAWIDYWGYDSTHDWDWWRKQIVYFMDHLLTEETVEYVI